jgi:hypothetical protein
MPPEARQAAGVAVAAVAARATTGRQAAAAGRSSSWPLTVQLAVESAKLQAATAEAHRLVLEQQKEDSDRQVRAMKANMQSMAQEMESMQREVAALRGEPPALRELSCSRLEALAESLCSAQARVQHDLKRKREEDRLCKVCFENEVAVVLQNCGHMILCAECAGHVSECPVCRSRKTGFQKVFRA